MENKIIDILKKNVYELAHVEITGETELISSGLLESFDVMNLISIFEKEFNINIHLDEIDLKDFNTLNNMVRMLNSYE